MTSKINKNAPLLGADTGGNGFEVVDVDAAFDAGLVSGREDGCAVTPGTFKLSDI